MVKFDAGLQGTQGSGFREGMASRQVYGIL